MKAMLREHLRSELITPYIHKPRNKNKNIKQELKVITEAFLPLLIEKSVFLLSGRGGWGGWGLDSLPT